MAETRSLNHCTACHMKASQVSVQLGGYSGSSILKSIIDKLPKPDERFN